LKRGHKGDTDRQASQGIDDIFRSDEEDEVDYGRPTHRRRAMHDEMDDFIEEDVFSDEERERGREDEEIARPIRKGISGLAITEATGLDENALEDMRAAFGDGTDYLFALEMEEEEKEREEEEERQLDLKDVFEPSLLKEKMLTDEDNEIRFTDEPERHQISRKPYKHVTLTDEEFREEAVWISNLMLLKKRIEPDLREPFQRSVGKVLEFMVTEDWEVPFIFQHRKDYLIHADKAPVSPDPNNPDAPQYTIRAQKLLNMTDLWDIFDYDLKFRAFMDKRHSLQKIYDKLQRVLKIQDEIIDELLPAATTMEELQDLQEYVHFQYGSEIKDLSLMTNGANGVNGTDGVDGVDDENGADGVNGKEAHLDTPRRRKTTKNLFERVRSSNIYNIVRAFGITADAFAQSALKGRRGQYTEDPEKPPEEIADTVLDINFTNASQALKAAKSMFAEELVMSPRMRKVLRQRCYMTGVVDCFRTDKGLRRIDEQHPYYEFKYLRSQQLTDIARRPELFLRMLKAEEEGFVNVKVRFQDFDRYRESLYAHIQSDNLSEVADSWNRERREVLDMALSKLEKLMSRSVKENIRQECENHVAKECRETFSQKLDQAPYKPKGMVLGTVPRVLALTNGRGRMNETYVQWVWVEEDGRMVESGQFEDLRVEKETKDVAKFVELVERRRPDVIALSGYHPDTRRLYRQLCDIVEKADLRGAPYTDEDDKEVSDQLEVVIINDETARAYSASKRAKEEFPTARNPVFPYCVGLARYLQSPMKEYAALGKDLVQIQFAPGQQYLSEEIVMRNLESALVDMVNLCGIDINEAITDTSTAGLLPYICGLGPRKASHLLKIVNMNGGAVNNRVELLGVNAQYPAMGVKVWNNCASFLYIDWENADPDADPLDNTRVHPEDYDIARKMAADALELDEEDIKAETDENGPGAIVRKLFKEEAQDRVNDLILEEYAEQLEKNLNQRKRATLETIRAELQQPYEELRKQFALPTTEEVFTMFTGETSETLTEGMVVPMHIKRMSPDHIDGVLDSGIEVLVPEANISDTPVKHPRELYGMSQTVLGKILYLNRKNFTAHMSLRQEDVRQSLRKTWEHMPGEWDDRQEQEDRQAQEENVKVEGRFMRVIKHPMFRPFNSVQAEEYLGTQSRGDCVIRPSSKGPDHLTVTWKVSDGVYQHIDVLELDKENEYSVGRTLKIGGKYTYSDLDELIVNHVQAMAKKVDEMMSHEKYQNGSQAATGMYFPSFS
jgi:transcription elongation factor SPT6